MTWTLDKYNPTTLIELSTLTGAVIISLGHSAAGLWTNN
jgi:leucyl aminopeptidase